MLNTDQMLLQRPLPMEKTWKSHVELAPNCPRCASSNTKFCYYNNYSLSQPRYICKDCRRYWTKGGSLRNVPVGGGCRKTSRAKSLRVSQDGHRTAFAKSFSGLSDRSNESRGEYSLAQETATTNGSSEIDLAVVFANFLNQDSSFQPEYMAMGQELPNDQACTQANSLTPDSAVIECDDKLTDLLIQECDSFLEGLCLPPAIVRDHQQQERIQELIESHEMVQDYSYLWSEAAATLSNATWETVVQPQEEFISSFSMDDELKISLIK
ncbi:hypothetical protein MANES_18G089000v8 [Manihot esculenta]|uniref:Uncharacterized protein n=2 Tax=Manihot esculenta TaxID=3983 RepID=A0ACB7FZ67_MANES|nr:hypothetical protein MANES_18G089000v8 [Manihot esculenta]